MFKKTASLIEQGTYSPDSRERHGGPYDRGSADSYYRRPVAPHWYPLGTGNGQRITDLNPLEIADYMAGFYENETSKNYKIWGTNR